MIEIDEPRVADPDGLYAALLDAYDGLDEAAAQRLNAGLVLLLANQIGDDASVREAIGLARKAAHAAGQRGGEKADAP